MVSVFYAAALRRLDEKAGQGRDAVSSRLEAHSRCKKETGHEEE
jgi:hypothetical protein